MESFSLTSQKRTKGFSLMELLIVISIIGILIAVGVASYTSAQAKSRNSRRKSDIKAVQDALEQYNADNSGSYPAASNPCNLGASSATYLPGGMPSDPKGGSYAYKFNCTATTAYCLCAQLEVTTTEGNASSIDCGSFGTAGSYFCAKNLQ